MSLKIVFILADSAGPKVVDLFYTAEFEKIHGIS